MSLPVRIVSVGSHTPSLRVTSAELDTAHLRSPGSTFARSGVAERRWIGAGEGTLSMTVGALSEALDRAGWSIDDLDALIVASVAPEQPMPTTAILAAARLGARDGTLQAFDVNASCLGFLTALQQASFGIAGGRWRRVAVVAVDVASKGLNHADLESSALFGDGWRERGVVRRSSRCGCPPTRVPPDCAGFRPAAPAGMRSPRRRRTPTTCSRWTVSA